MKIYGRDVTVKKCGQKAASIMKKLRPGHIMFGAMLVMTCMNKCTPTPPPTKDHAEMMKEAYQMGEQRIRDSLKIVELKNKIVADSMKYYHNLPQGTTKIVKAIK